MPPQPKLTATPSPQPPQVLRAGCPSCRPTNMSGDFSAARFATAYSSGEVTRYCHLILVKKRQRRSFLDETAHLYCRRVPTTTGIGKYGVSFSFAFSCGRHGLFLLRRLSCMLQQLPVKLNQQQKRQPLVSLRNIQTSRQITHSSQLPLSHWVQSMPLFTFSFLNLVASFLISLAMTEKSAFYFCHSVLIQQFNALLLSYRQFF